MLWFVSAAVIALAPEAAAVSSAPSASPDLPAASSPLVLRADASACDTLTVREIMERRAASRADARANRVSTSDYRTVGACEAPAVMRNRLPASVGRPSRAFY